VAGGVSRMQQGPDFRLMDLMNATAGRDIFKDPGLEREGHFLPLKSALLTD
jgi:hypothetical protein